MNVQKQTRKSFQMRNEIIELTILSKMNYLTKIPIISKTPITIKNKSN
jgi:hypothetical protein